ncbi:MAG: hypothetical protein ACYCX4_01715 [Bacillota bacterium]
MVIGDALVVQAIKDGLAMVKANTTLLDDILTSLEPEELAEAKTWFGNAKNRVNVFKGFPRNPAAEVPCVSVTLAGEQETDEPMGDFVEIDEEASDYQEIDGSWFVSNYKATVFTENANLTVWIQTVAKWVLLVKRAWLQEQGLVEQSLSSGDFEPVPEYFPDFVYTRAVNLNAKHFDAFVVMSAIWATQADVTLNVSKSIL